jgi:hypothetical protein|tara:strand:+ start:273 stop:530 length:258 start_codon:yes stop_codon:yes gene_type:complete
VQKIIKAQETKSIITFTKSLGGNMQTNIIPKKVVEDIRKNTDSRYVDNRSLKLTVESWFKAQERIKAFNKYLKQEKIIGGNNADQ